MLTKTTDNYYYILWSNYQSITNTDCSVVQPEDVSTLPRSGHNWHSYQEALLDINMLCFLLKEDDIGRNTLLDII